MENMVNLELALTVEEVMRHEQELSPRLVLKSKNGKWVVLMPYRHKFSEKELKYLKRYGLEDFMNWQYSLYEQKVWDKIKREVKKIIKPVVDDWELHDDYIYPVVEIAEPDEKMVNNYVRRFKKMNIL